MHLRNYGELDGKIRVSPRRALDDMGIRHDEAFRIHDEAAALRTGTLRAFRNATSVLSEEIERIRHPIGVAMTFERRARALYHDVHDCGTRLAHERGNVDGSRERRRNGERRSRARDDDRGECRAGCSRGWRMLRRIAAGSERTEDESRSNREGEEREAFHDRQNKRPARRIPAPSAVICRGRRNSRRRWAGSRSYCRL